MTAAPRNIILLGDVRKRLAELPPSSVDTVITSPPYSGVGTTAMSSSLDLNRASTTG